MTRAIASEEALGDNKPADDLLEMEGMERELAFKLAAQRGDHHGRLAELAVPELLEIEPELSEEKAAALILKAREPWFAEEAEAAAE